MLDFLRSGVFVLCELFVLFLVFSPLLLTRGDSALHNEGLPLENGGEASRDFVYVEDLVEPGEVYNLAAGQQTKICDLAWRINELSETDTPVELKPARNWDQSGLRFGSTEKSKKLLGFEAKTSRRDGLAKTIAWTIENRDLIGRGIARHSYFLARLPAERT